MVQIVLSILVGPFGARFSERAGALGRVQPSYSARASRKYVQVSSWLGMAWTVWARVKGLFAFTIQHLLLPMHPCFLGWGYRLASSIIFTDLYCPALPYSPTTPE